MRRAKITWKNEIKNVFAQKNNPSKKRIVIVLIFIIVSFVFGYCFDYFLDQTLTKLTENTDVYLYIRSDIKSEANKQYLPVIIKNIGDTLIQEGDLYIASCDMIDSNGNYQYIHYRFPTIQKNGEYEIRFADNLTLHEFQTKDCSPEINPLQKGLSFQINLYSNKTLETNGRVCGICFFSAKIYSGSFKRIFPQLNLTNYPVKMNITQIPN